MRFSNRCTPPHIRKRTSPNRQRRSQTSIGGGQSQDLPSVTPFSNRCTLPHPLTRTNPYRQQTSVGHPQGQALHPPYATPFFKECTQRQYSSRPQSSFLYPTQRSRSRPNARKIPGDDQDAGSPTRRRCCLPVNRRSL